MYSIRWDTHAVSALEQFHPDIARRIVKKVLLLQDGPEKLDTKRLKGSTDFRLRVGDYRIIFSIEQTVITILKVGHRKNIYDR